MEIQLDTGFQFGLGAFETIAIEEHFSGTAFEKAETCGRFPGTGRSEGTGAYRQDGRSILARRKC